MTWRKLTLPKVYYKRLIEGVTVPAIIHNMQYFFISMPVYEDGSLDCWKRLPLTELENQLSDGWLVTSIPSEKKISIHSLGSYTIHHAQWEYTPNTYVKYIHNCVKQMNHGMVGLFKETSEQKAKWKSRKTGWSATGIPYKIKENFGYSITEGTSTNIFYCKEDSYILTSITAYADDTLYLEHTDSTLSIKQVETMFETGELCSSIDGKFEFIIPKFATLVVTASYQTETQDKLIEIKDILAKAKGEQTSLEHCRDIYQEYLIYPTDYHREKLRKAYEAVPEHQRMFLGDMDMRDSDYIRIIYYSDQKREV